MNAKRAAQGPSLLVGRQPQARGGGHGGGGGGEAGGHGIYVDVGRLGSGGKGLGFENRMEKTTGMLPLASAKGKGRGSCTSTCVGGGREGGRVSTFSRTAQPFL